MPNLFNSKQLQKELSISRHTLSEMEKVGLPYSKNGNSKQYDKDEVISWIEKQRKDIRSLTIGSTYKNADISEAFKCSPQGGMKRSHKTNTLVILSDHTNGIYEDKWIINDEGEEILLYSGMGQEGDQDINYAQNKVLNESPDNSIHVYLFEAYSPGNYVFKGQVELAAEPYQSFQGGRQVWIFPLRLLESKSIPPLDLINEKESIKQKEAEKMSDEDLLNRAKNPEQVGQRYTTSKTFDRDPYVSEYVKRRAKGNCDLCGKPAPFRDKKGKPYLESHHIVWLARGGEDTIKNTVALDPSCHKKMHILDLQKDVDLLVQRVKEYEA
ncbi:HNH endonuclease [Bacillus sp. SCS-153A]|uniref:HNH endonuclease n=1 Tax=Rossellomorea sedimentorum TaxID=3115294 RepID=UPI0039062BD8